MSTAFRCVVLYVLFAAVGIAQQSASLQPRIICAPPRMKVLKMVKPKYPAQARTGHIAGSVAVEAEIDKAGKPTNIKVLKGDPVLIPAVVEAVKQWRWKPLKLNGVAVEATTTITVNFEGQ